MAARRPMDPMRRIRRYLLVLLATLAASWTFPGYGQDTGAAGATGDAAATASDGIEEDEEDGLGDAVPLSYEVAFEGLADDSNTTEIVMQVAETGRLVDQPPTSLSRLRRRAMGDVPRLLQALRARGHYQAKVEVDIDQDTAPITVTFKIDRGPTYRYNQLVIELDPPTADDVDLPGRKKLNLASGDRVRSLEIIQAETRLLEAVKEQGFANAELGPRSVVVDHNTAQMDITFRLNLGQKIHFGETVVTGNDQVEARYVRRLLDWKEGQLVTPERLRTTQLNLIETGLFNSVRIEPGKEPDAEGRVPISIEVGEAKHRTVEAGVRYRSDEGIGGSAGWQHRNLLGTGEQLAFELDGSEIGWHLNGEAREPDFLRRRQALVIGAEIAVENTDAFESQSIGASLGIERLVGDGMSLAAGVAFRALEVEQDGDKDSFGLLSLPASFVWDHSDNLLDPSRGGRLTIQNEPFVDVFGNDVAFNKSSVAYSRYLRLKKDNPRLILAARAKAGFLFGAERDNVRRMSASMPAAAARCVASAFSSRASSTTTTTRSAAAPCSRPQASCAPSSAKASVPPCSSTAAPPSDRRSRTSRNRCASARAPACAISARSARSGSTSASRLTGATATILSRSMSASARPSEPACPPR
ncbi:MAG: BamA/TamA family outer membrane protein [Rhizobiales bacterium]|nr:BamA/TamA family outer membrane protein [Hyphomicrobiales bacterium]